MTIKNVEVSKKYFCVTKAGMEDIMAYNKQVSEVVQILKSDVVKGLTDQQAGALLEEHGPNSLMSKEGISPLKRFIKQFEDFMIWILMGAAGISFFTHEVADGFIILAIVLLNGVLGFVQENNAEKSMQALKSMQVPEAQVLRNGQVVKLPSPQIVPGDIVLLNAGDVVPADGRLVEAAALRIEESQLTGESLPVDKHSDVIQSDELSIGDRHNMAYATSRVTAGRGKLIVTATGMKTEIGKIAGMLDSEEDEKTPLQIKLAELGKTLGIAAVVICALIFVIGAVQGRNLFEMLMIAISLAVAAIPEGLPAIVTIVLAMGVKKMINANAIVRKLPAVETLGSASVICSDKTGTLTQNKMTVVELFSNRDIVAEELGELSETEKQLYKTAVYCNDGAISIEDGVEKQIGDPTETALLAMALKYDITQQSLAGKRVSEVPFDSDRKLMTTIIEEDATLTCHVKGAPDQLLSRCTKLYEEGQVIDLTEQKRTEISKVITEKSHRALRVLAFAYKPISALPAEVNTDTIENDLIFIGLTGMIDPPREEVKDAVKTAHTAGIRTVMITGDYKDTAVAIARQLGILGETEKALSGSELDALSDEAFADVVEDISVFARVSPEHKIRIVKALKAKGKIIAMTGDGVNDAPALKAADIGCAMGITGTDVSKEASDLILIDDNFTTIVAAVKEGRTIYDNIKKAVNFLLSSNTGEIFTLLVAIIMNLPTPLLAIHILWINLVTDSFPALALGVEASEKDIMKRKPRDPETSILGNGLMWDILLQGVMIGCISLAAFLIGLKDDITAARTMTFITLSLTQLVHSFNVRSRRQSLLKMGVFSNKRLNQGVLVSLGALLFVYFVPFTRVIFKLKLLTSFELVVAFGFGLIPFVVMEVVKAVKRSKNNQ